MTRTLLEYEMYTYIALCFNSEILFYFLLTSFILIEHGL